MQMSRYLRKIYCIYAVTRIHLILYQIYDILYEEKIDRIKNLLILLFVVMSTWKLFSKKKIVYKMLLCQSKLSRFRRRFCKLFFAKKTGLICICS